MATAQKILIGSVRNSYIVSNNAGALAYHRVWLTDQCDIKSSSGKIDFAGDGQKITKFYGYQLEGNLKASADDAVLDSILYNTPQVAAATIAAPTVAPTPTASGTGSGLAAGVYTVGYTYRGAQGETTLSPTVTVTLTAGQSISIAALATPPAGTTGVNYYVSIAAGTATTGFAAENLNGGAISISSYGNATPAPGTNSAASDDFAYRYVKGGQGELQPNNVEVRVSLDAYDGDTDAPLVVRYRILRCQFAPDTPPSFKSEAMAGRDLQFTSYLAVSDVAGNALTGVPSNGCFMVKDIISNTANFDPDSELIF